MAAGDLAMLCIMFILSLLAIAAALDNADVIIDGRYIEGALRSLSVDRSFGANRTQAPGRQPIADILLRLPKKLLKHGTAIVATRNIVVHNCTFNGLSTSELHEFSVHLRELQLGLSSLYPSLIWPERPVVNAHDRKFIMEVLRSIRGLSRKLDDLLADHPCKWSLQYIRRKKPNRTGVFGKQIECVFHKNLIAKEYQSSLWTLLTIRNNVIHGDKLATQKERAQFRSLSATVMQAIIMQHKGGAAHINSSIKSDAMRAPEAVRPRRKSSLSKK